MKRINLMKLLYVFVASMLVWVAIGCTPKRDTASRRTSYRNDQMRQRSMDDMRKDDDGMRSDYSNMPKKRHYDDQCCSKPDCDWCRSRCGGKSPPPDSIYAPREPQKRQCQESCDPCGCDCGCDPCCDDCCGCGCDPCCDDCCDPCDDCGCGCDSCCDPCDDCGCGCDPCCDDCCDDCCDPCCSARGGREYTRDEIFGRETQSRYENRHDSRRYEEAR